MAEAGGVLLIDIGNSRVKWGWARGGRIEVGEPFATQDVPVAFPASWNQMPPPEQVLVASVAAPGVAAELQAWTEWRWHLAPRFVRPQAEGSGVASGYDEPEKLGVDRWVALVGARHACAGPVCVADCGTAITFDALDAEGRHLGGLIAPGLALMRDSLARGTSGLLLAGGKAQHDLARDTVSAIASGTALAAAGLVERALRQATRQVGGEPRLLLTGGDAPSIANVLEVPSELRPALVLEGLFAIAQSQP